MTIALVTGTSSGIGLATAVTLARGGHTVIATMRNLESAGELQKIVAATADDAGEPASDLRLCVRLRVSSEYSELSLASKFGIDLAELLDPSGSLEARLVRSQLPSEALDALAAIRAAVE